MQIVGQQYPRTETSRLLTEAVVDSYSAHVANPRRVN